MDATPGPAAPARSASEVFSEIALELHEADDAEQTIERIVEYSRDAVAGDEAGVLLLHARGRFDTVAPTSADVTRAHELQIKLDEGPCLEASEDPTKVFRIDDCRTEARWPRWCSEVSAMDIRSVLAVPLATRTRRYGAINLYARRPDAFDETDEEVGLILARHASVALAASHHIDGLKDAVDGRKMIGIATGVLMARYDIDSPTAFEVLRRYSQAHNLKLRDVAARVADERALPEAWD